MRPKVVIAGILDTKGEEIKFIAQAVREAGGEPTVMELSVGKETGWADIGLSELLVPIGKKPARPLCRGQAQSRRLGHRGGYTEGRPRCCARANWMAL